MGMIGTLVGLVAMLANMSDPKSIGPAMAVALLTTLYGAIEANMIAIPIADKLELRSGEEQLSRTPDPRRHHGDPGWTEPEGDPGHVAELPESVQTQQRDRIGAHRWQSASARLPDCPVTWNLRGSHVPADVFLRALALLCRDGCAEVQADRRFHGEGVRGAEHPGGQGYPQGTSVIAQEFRPGRPEPTPIDTIMQQTIDMTQTELDFQPGDADKAGGHDKTEGQQSGGDTAQEAQKAQEQSNTLAKALAEQMQAQIQDGAIEIEALGQQIIIRIREKAAFPAGSAFLQPQFWPVIRKVAALLKDVPGRSPSPATPTMWPPRTVVPVQLGAFIPAGGGGCPPDDQGARF